MSQFRQVWDNLNSDPRFLELDYEEQQKVRAQWASRNLPKDEAFTRLSQDGQAAVFQNLVTQAPALAQVSDWSRQALDIAQTVRHGSEDPVAYNDAVTRAARAVSAQGHTGMAGWAGKLMKWATGKAVELQAEVYGLSEQQEQIEFEMHLPNKRDNFEDFKAYRYLEDTVRQSDDVQGWDKFMMNFSPFMGIMTNVLSAKAVGRPLVGAVAGLGQAAAAKTSSPQFLPWLYGRAMPAAVDWGFDASFLTMADLMANKVEENTRLGIPNETGSQYTKIALNFGSNYLLDALLFSSFSVMSTTARAGAKVFRWRGMAAARGGNVGMDELADAIGKVTSGQQMSRAQFLSFPKDVQTQLMRIGREFQAAARLGPADMEDLVSGLIRKQGFDLIKKGKKYTMRSIVGGDMKDVPGSFTTPQKALRGLYEFQHVPPDQVARAMDAAVTGNLGVQAYAKAKLSAVPRLDKDTVARALVPDASGRLQPGAIQTATRAVLQEVGAGSATAKKLSVKAVAGDAYWKMNEAARIQDARIYVPDVIRTPEEMSRFLNRYWIDVATIAPENAQRSLRYLTDVVETVPRLESGMNPLFVEATARASGVPFVRRPDGLYQIGDEVASTVAEASDKLQLQILMRDADSIKKAFRQFRFSIEQGEDGKWLARAPKSVDGGNIISGQHNSIEGVADELLKKGFVPRLSQNRAANVVIDESGKSLEIWEGMVRGPHEFVRDYAKQFVEEVSETAAIRKFGANTIRDGHFRHMYRVVSPDWGVAREFGKMENAVAYVGKRWESLDALREMGFMKGVLEITPTEGHLVTRELGGKTRSFKSVGELRDWLRAKPADPVWQKEIANIDRSMVDTVMDQMTPEMREMYGIKPGTPQPVDFGDMLQTVRESPTWKVKEYVGDLKRGEAVLISARSKIQAIKDQFQTPLYARVRRLSGQEGLDQITDVFESMEKANFNARGLLAQTSELLDKTLRFKGAPSVGRRALLKPLLEQAEDTWDTYAKNVLGTELTGMDREFLKRFRMVSDGFGAMFGVDPYKMVSHYLPRLQGFIRENPQVLQGSAMASDVIKKTPFAHAKEMQFFSEYLRAEELVTFLREADPMQVLAKYVQKGVKNMTLGQTYEAQKEIWQKLVRESAGTDGLQAANFTMQHYLEEMMGMYTDEASALARHSARETANVFARLAKAGKDTPAVKDWINTMHGFTIASTMSFRPWPVIRNMMQPWMTLAPMYGNDKVMNVMGKIASDEKWLTETATRLRESGRLQPGIPIFGINYETSRLTGWFNKLGMKWFKNSDDYTRVVVDGVVRDTFTDATARLHGGAFGTGAKAHKKFLRAANLHRLDDFDQRKIVDLLQNRGFESAMDYYGDVVTRETMYAYTAGSNPAMFKGMWGRLFGMFGHWPVYYAQTLANGLRRGSAFDKAQFVGRVMFNSAVLWTTFDRAIGVRADNFVPWKTMFFDGGPYFKLLSDAMKAAAGSPKVSWDEVRRDGTRLMIPGSIVARNFGMGLEMMERGQTYDGMLRLLSIPNAPDRL